MQISEENEVGGGDSAEREAPKFLLEVDVGVRTGPRRSQKSLNV